MRLICLLLLGIASRQLPSQEPTEELWFGTIKTQSQRLRVELHLSFDRNGQCTGYGTLLDQNSIRIPLASGSRVDGQWSLDFKSTSAKFQGKQSKDGGLVEGVLSQKGDIPLQLQRVATTPPLQASKVYRGEMNAIVKKLQMQIRFIDGEQFDGKPLVLVDSLSEGLGSFVGSYEEQGGQRIINVPGLDAKWQGIVSKDVSRWEGSWIQGKIPFPLNLELQTAPVDLARVVKSRPQNPRPPFPYIVREIDWENEAGKVRLSGTLNLPAQGAPRAAIVLISGEGPQDRDETLADHKPFAVIADYLARQQIAVLRFDERGVGRSTGRYATAVAEDFISDAISAWHQLRKQITLPSSKIGMYGHGEGATVVLTATAQQPDIGFLVLVAGTGWTGRRLAIEQTILLAQKQGSGKETTSALRQLLEKHSDLVLANLNAADFKSQLDALISSYLKSAEIPAGQAATARAVLGGRLGQLNTPLYRDYLNRNPANLLPQLKQPMLAIWGSEDLQIPAQGNRDAMQDALGKGKPHPLTKLEVLPKLNHLLQPCKTGQIDEYDSIEITIDPQALRLFAQFILDAAARP